MLVNTCNTTDVVCMCAIVVGIFVVGLYHITVLGTLKTSLSNTLNMSVKHSA